MAAAAGVARRLAGCVAVGDVGRGPHGVGLMGKRWGPGGVRLGPDRGGRGQAAAMAEGGDAEGILRPCSKCLLP